MSKYEKLKLQGNVCLWVPHSVNNVKAFACATNQSNLIFSICSEHQSTKVTNHLLLIIVQKKKNPSHFLTFYCEHFRHLVFFYVSGDKIFFFFFEEMV